MNLDKAKQLLKGPLNVVGLGLDNIVEGAKATGATVLEVQFKPPAGGDPQRMQIGRAHV